MGFDNTFFAVACKHMKLRSTSRAVLMALSLCTTLAADSTKIVVPLPRTHAHNDYEHRRPLLDALDHGFCSIEADIYLVDGQLLVAHDRDKVRPERTLQALYLDPLRARIQQNAGRLYKDGPPAILLIDVKSEGDATYSALRKVLLNYTNILTSFSSSGTQTQAMTAIISGNRPDRNLLRQEPTRYAALDGRPEDLDTNPPVDLVPLVSEDWKQLFQWRGMGQFPDHERQRLRDFVDKAHRQGRKVRFWGTPDRVEMWRVLANADVDLLNADDLAGLESFFLSSEAAKGPRTNK
jgi:hypothetical protein